jgi:hypothetical protein
MKKSIIKLALDSLELRLMQDRQEAKRKKDLLYIDSLNEKIDLVRKHQKELEIVNNYIELY